MNIFIDRFSSKYEDELMQHLALKGKNGLLKNAIRIARPFKYENKEYDRIARIDFVGIAATTLFDIGGNFIQSKVPQRIEDLCSQIEFLNSKGIFLRFRLLFIYPYSDYAFSMIQAETSTSRSSVEEPEYIRDFKIVEEVDQSKFWGSKTIINQQNSLEQIGSILKSNPCVFIGNGPNKIRVRFTPTAVSTCMLLINDTGFVDSYLFSKQKRKSNSLSYSNPVNKITKIENKKGFKSFEDHFRYLWTLDTTLYCEDATNFSKDNISGLSKIVSPDKINFDNKAQRIQLHLKESNPEKSYTEDDINSWKFKLTHLLGLSTQLTRISPQQETLFITCSWKEDETKNKYLPNEYAKNLSKWLNRDFGLEQEKPCLKVNIMEAAIGTFLFQQLYKTLNETTLAVILMTKDIKSEDGLFYSRPNVYHELGFLMKHLVNTSRVAVLLEEGVFEPSNIKSLSRISFNTKNFDEKYYDLVKWLEDSKTFINGSYFTKARENQKLK